MLISMIAWFNCIAMCFKINGIRVEPNIEDKETEYIHRTCLWVIIIYYYYLTVIILIFK